MASLPVIGPAFQVAGAGVSMLSAANNATNAINSGKTRQNISDYNSEVADNNATMATDQANYNAAQQNIALRQVYGTQRADIGANGVSGVSGQNVNYNTVVAGNLDQLATKYQGQIRSNYFQSEATLDTIEGQVDNEQGEATASADLLNGVGSALSGAAAAYGASSHLAGYNEQPTINSNGSGASAGSLDEDEDYYGGLFT